MQIDIDIDPVIDQRVSQSIETVQLFGVDGPHIAGEYSIRGDGIVEVVQTNEVDAQLGQPTRHRLGDIRIRHHLPITDVGSEQSNFPPRRVDNLFAIGPQEPTAAGPRFVQMRQIHRRPDRPI